MANNSADILEEYSDKEYEFGFVTDIEMDIAPRGLNEDTIHFISAKKKEPQWLLDWRLKAYQSFYILLCRPQIQGKVQGYE